MPLEVLPQIVLPGEDLPAQTTPEYGLGQPRTVCVLDMLPPGGPVSPHHSTPGADHGLGGGALDEGVGVQVTWNEQQ